MALDIAISIASKIAEYTVAPIGRQIGYLVFYKSNVNNLKSEVENLEAAKDDLHQSVDAAIQKGEEIMKTVQNWLEKADGTVAEAKKVYDNEGQAKAACPNLMSRHRLSRKAKKMAQDIPNIIAAGTFQTISHLPSLVGTIPSPFARSYEALESRTSILNKIMQTLKDANVYMVGVCGMGGVGKSTLIKELAWRAEKDGSYGTVVVVNVSNSPDVKRIQGEIKDRLGLQFNEETQVGRASRLRERILKEKCILIILDDIWKKLDLTEVGVPFGDDHKGCKLLLTSRSLDVLTDEMGVQKDFAFRLEVLSKAESWSLFEKTAPDVVKDRILLPTAKKVAEACAGLPLLITTVANALKDKDPRAWKDALQQLTRFHHKDLTDKVYSAIELSFNNLANDELKSLFLLLGSFGQTTIWTRYLLIYFWSLGLYEQADTLANARNRLYRLVTDLKSACLLLEGEGESVKMHDLVHEVAGKLASKERPIFAVRMHGELEEWPEMDKIRKCYRMFLPDCRIHDLPERLECPELKILVLVSRNNFLKVPDHFFAETKELKVLYLGGMDCTPSLPTSLSHLPKLRALYLRECMLEDIAIVAELKMLEILGFEISEIRELPAVIGQLVRLRLLDLSNCSGLRSIPAKLISSLTRLEELYMVNSYIQWEVEGSKNQSQSNNATLGELRHLQQLTALEIMIQDASVLPKDLLVFGQLEKYRIFIGDEWKCTWNSKISKTLKLNQGKAKNVHLDHGIQLLFNSVEELCLAELKGVRNVLHQLNEEGFPELKHLDIQNSDEMQYVMDSTGWGDDSRKAFPKLESLVLHNLANMRKICDGQLPVQSFTKLEVIKVKGCDRLESLFLYSMVKDISQLVEVEISQCKTMSEIIADDDTKIDKIEFPKLRSLTIDCVPMLASFYSKPMKADMESIPAPLFDEKISFPNLESLKLSSINLRKIWDDQLSQHSCMQKLKSLTIDGCGNLKFLFSSSVARRFVNLQHLSITGCGMLEEIFFMEEKMGNLPPATKSLSSEEAAFPSLETLVISRMDSLKAVWNNQLAPNSFGKLIKLEISFCNKLMNVMSSYVLKNLSKLETMLVTSCDALEVVFEIEGLNSGAGSQHGLTTQLRTLTLECLPMLKHIWSMDPCGSPGFQNLSTVKATECQSLNYVFPLSVAMELLQLEVLDISSSGIEHIVAKDDETTETVPKFVLQQLKSLRFSDLEELRSFCPGMQTLDCPNLKELDVYHCDNLEIFAPKSQNCQDVSVDRQPLFSFEKVIQIVEELTLSSEDVTVICNDQQSDDDFYKVKALSLECFHDMSDEFPSSFLQRFTNLEKLRLFCSSFERILHSEHTETNTRLRTLSLNTLWDLENICQEKSQMEQILQNIETLEVFHCPSLKTIVPSSVLFQNLDTLWVYNCAGLVNIMASSTARSFPTLRRLWIYNCDMIEEIVASEDGDAGEIVFMKLEVLELGRLPRLTSFCKGNQIFKFPLLKSLYVIECPMMETFSQGILSSPLLRYISLTTSGNEWRWDGDLNTTIRKNFSQSHSKEV